MSLMDLIDKYASPAMDLYNLYDNYKNRKDSSEYIRGSDPYGPANAEAGRQLAAIMADGGAAYMQTPGAQNALNRSNEAYFRTQQGSGDRLSTGAAERRESQSLTLYDQILNAQIGRLQGVPRENINTGRDLSSIDRQYSYDQNYGVDKALQSLGGLFGGGEDDDTSGSFRNRTNDGQNDGWWE